jgi:hypothetical protein
VRLSNKYIINQALGAEIMLTNPINFERARIPVKQKAIATRMISTCISRGLDAAPSKPNTIAMITGPRIPARKAFQNGRALI